MKLTTPEYLHHVNLFFCLLPLLGYKREPLTSLTIVYRNSHGHRYGFNPHEMWVNR